MQKGQVVHAEGDHHMHLVAPFGCVYWDSRLSYLHLEWTRYFEGQAFRDAYETVLAAIVEHKATRLLSDSTHRGLISGVDQHWIDDIWIPRMLAAGITRIAVVLPAGAIGRLSIAGAMRSLPRSPAATAAMSSVAEAVAWLTSA